MFVTLAYPYEGHAPDETVEVDDDAGRFLVRDGLARLPDVDVLGDLTVIELKEYAADHDIDLGGATKKDDLVAAIRDAESSSVPAMSPTSTIPATTATTEGEQ